MIYSTVNNEPPPLWGTSIVQTVGVAAPAVLFMMHKILFTYYTINNGK